MNPVVKHQIFCEIYSKLNLDVLSTKLLLEAIQLRNQLEEEEIQYRMECDYIDKMNNREITDSDLQTMNDYYNKEQSNE